MIVRTFYCKFPYVHDAMFHIVQVYLTIKSEKRTLLTTPLSPKSNVKRECVSKPHRNRISTGNSGSSDALKLWEEQEKKATLPGCTQFLRERVSKDRVSTVYNPDTIVTTFH